MTTATPLTASPFRSYDFDKIAAERNSLTLQAGEEQATLFTPLEEAEYEKWLDEMEVSEHLRVSAASDIIDELQAAGFDLTQLQPGVLDSIEATGPAATRITGDYAQISVGVTGSEVQTLGLMEWTLDLKRKTVESTTTDDYGGENSLGSTYSWTAKAKFAFIDGDPSQISNVLGLIDGSTPAAGPVTVNFFPTTATGRIAFQGQAIVDGATITAGTGKVVANDVSMKGILLLKRLVQAAPGIVTTTTTGQQAEV